MDIFDVPHKPTVVTKKPLSGRGAGFGADAGDAPIGSPASAWRDWKAREVGAGMKMDVDPVEMSGKQKGRVKGKLQYKLAVEADVDMASLGGRENVKQKGKGKLVRIDEDIEMDTLETFVVPVLPARGSVRSAARGVVSNQNTADAS